ncbi:hypothetical protein PI124_g10304 [Phytophthora idaei]|nr:hypothetical protein PI125_g8514 [Phytophthora idaei]KAG3157376.1 hypothetical protein PI126_g8351 [Phytophthora idaei]KAG3244937.1 hypothetical protein PI124_g10304 [Phytophthora idaei]
MVEKQQKEELLLPQAVNIYVYDNQYKNTPLDAFKAFEVVGILDLMAPGTDTKEDNTEHVRIVPRKPPGLPSAVKMNKFLVRGIGFFNDAYDLFVMNVVNVALTEQYGKHVYTSSMKSWASGMR